MGKPRHSNVGWIFAVLSILAITAAVGLAFTSARAFATGPPATIIAIPTTTPQSEWYGTNSFPLPLEARVLDASGNPVSGVTVTFTAPSTDPSAGWGWYDTKTNTKTTDANGIATSDNLSGSGSTGSFEVSAVAAGVASSAVFELTNASGSPYTVTTASSFPETAELNEQFAPNLEVTVTDGNSNPVVGAAVTFTAYTGDQSGHAGGATALFTGSQPSVSVTTNAVGVATAPALTANGLTGTYVVTASTPSGYAPTSWTLTNTDEPLATIIAIPTTTPQSEWYGTNSFPLPLEARVLDASGNPVSGVTVTFTAPSTDPSAGWGWYDTKTNTKTTDANGIATSDNLSGSGSTGSFEVSAVAAGVASSAVFQLTNSSGSPYSVTASASSTPQTAPVGTRFVNSLAVTVRDSNSVPVSDVRVTFAAFTANESGKAGTATGTFAGSQQSVSVVTNDLGVATAPAFTADSATGSYVVTAWTGDGYQPAVFQLRNAIVPIKPALTLKLSGLTSGVLKLGKSLTAKGTVTPTSLAGGKVKLTVQTKKGATWVTVKSVACTISASGSYSATYKPAKLGSYRIQATMAKTATNAAAATKWLPFRVKSNPR